MILTLTLNPAIDKRLYVSNAVLGGTNKCRLTGTDLSGKGINVALAASVLLGLYSNGAAIGGVTAAGFIAKPSVPLYTKLLNKYGVVPDFTPVNGVVRTNIKLMEQSGRETEFNEDGFAVTKADIRKMLSSLRKYYKKYNVLCLSGSLPKGAPQTIYADIIAEAKASGASVILDTSGEAFKAGACAAPYAVKPNLSELEEYSGKKLKTPAAIKKQAQATLGNGIKLCAVTVGKSGAFFITNNEALHAYIDKKINVKSAIGAGDACTAALAVSILRNLPLAQTAKLCVASSTASCTAKGTAPGKAEDINKLYDLVKVDY